MTVELQPLGTACHLACGYCYQEPIRDAANTSARGHYDIDRMIERGLSLGSMLTVFGGEPLLVPLEDLEKIFKASFEAHGGAGIQTAGDLITDRHIDLFQRYKVGVGVSIDGPGELNSLRVRRASGDWGTSTQSTIQNIEKMRAAGVAVSVIVTLHRQNGTPSRLPRLKEFGLWLAHFGVTSVNVHSLESESAALKDLMGLNESEERAAMLDLAEWLESQPSLQWQPFQTMKALLNSDASKANCIWRSCDPLTTPAVQAVLADGSLSNCGRTSKEGIPWVKASQAGYERYISLYQTPQEFGGCKDCRFFLVCGGQCPGEAVNQDWRLKTEHCSMLMSLFRFYEDRMLNAGSMPISVHPERRQLEAKLMQMFVDQKRPGSFADLLDLKPGPKEKGCGCGGHGDSHGDFHGDAPHGDSPHGDSSKA